MTTISWGDFKASHPAKFESLVTRVEKEYGVDRGSAIDILDESFTFEQLPDGRVQVTNDTNGRYSIVPGP